MVACALLLGLLVGWVLGARLSRARAASQATAAPVDAALTQAEPARPRALCDAAIELAQAYERVANDHLDGGAGATAAGAVLRQATLEAYQRGAVDLCRAIVSDGGLPADVAEAQCQLALAALARGSV